MGILLALTVGYVAGAKAGPHGFEEIRSAIQTIRESEEVAALWAALRSHAGFALREFSDLLTNEEEQVAVGDLVARVRRMAGEAEVTWRAS